MSKMKAAFIVLVVCAITFGADAIFQRDHAVFAIAAAALYVACRGSRLGERD